MIDTFVVQKAEVVGNRLVVVGQIADESENQRHFDDHFGIVQVLQDSSSAVGGLAVFFYEQPQEPRLQWTYNILERLELIIDRLHCIGSGRYDHLTGDVWH